MNKRVLLILCVILTNIGSLWGGGSTYYAKLQAKVSNNSPSGSGLVYAGTNTTDAPTFAASSTSSLQKTSTENEKKIFYAYAQANDGFLFKGWAYSDGSAQIASSSNPYPVEITCSSDDENNPTTKIVYAVFEETPPTTITYVAPTNGTYTATYSDATITMTPGADSQSKQSKEAITLTATPAEGYKFLRWVKVVDGVKSGVAFKAISPVTFAEDATVYAEFIPETWAVFSVDGALFADLNEANTAANSTKTIAVVQDGILIAGYYTISSDVTLVIPYEETGTKAITSPKDKESVLSNADFGIKAFRTLKLVAGANIDVYGAISITAELQSGDASHNPTGFPCRYTGVLDMSEGGHININSGATLYAWGFVRGQGYLDGNNTKDVGTITAKNGATIKECYGLGDWGGGSYTYAVNKAKKDYRIYPFQSYFVQNIEVPLRLEYGASDLLYLNVYANESQNAIPDIKFIGKDVNYLFRVLSADGAVTKWYDPTTDRLIVELEGDSKLDNLQMKISYSFLSIDVNSNEFDLPVLSNMHIKLKKCNLTLSSPMVMQANSIFEVPKGSSLALTSNLFVYDREEWNTFVAKKYFCELPATAILTPRLSKGNGLDKSLMSDAKLIVDGTLTITDKGSLYTTLSGADITSNGGGQIVWKRSLPENGNVYGYTNGNSFNGSLTSSTLKSEYIVSNSCPAAWMHNDNDSYTRPTDNTTFDNLHGRWFAGDAKNEKADHTYDFTYLNSDADITTDAIYWIDATGEGHWNNATQEGVTYANTWRGTEEEDGVTAYYCYTTYAQDGTEQTGWVKLVRMGTSDDCGGSDNNIYQYVDDKWQSIGATDGDCLYTRNGVRQALVGGALVAVTKNTTPEDGAWHATDNETQYYVDLSSGACLWSPATKVQGVEKAYMVEGQTYIRYDMDGTGEDWMAVEYESPYYYTVDNQNVRTYYEYNATEVKWQIATPKVSVTDKNGTGMYYFLADAVAAANTTYNPTITFLADMEQTLKTDITLSNMAKSTAYTIDLNGHTITLTRNISGTTIGTTNRFFNIAATNMAVTIKDGSSEQNGAIYCKATGNGYATGVHVSAGLLNIESGKLYVENNIVRKTNTSERVYGVYVNAGATFNMQGGILETASEYYSWAVNGAGSSTTTPSTINIRGGTVNANAYYNARGVTSTGNINVSGGTINATTGPMFSCANGHQHAYGILASASANAKEENAYHAKLKITGGTINANVALNYAYGVYVDAAATTCTSSADYANVSSAEAVIDGGVINAISKSTYAYGLYVKGGPNSYSKSDDVKTVVNHVTIDVKATAYVYGIFAGAEIDEWYAGRKYGVVEINDCDVTATATSSYNAYGAYVSAATKMLNDNTYLQAIKGNNNSKTWYTDNINATEKNTYKYKAGYWGIGGKMTIKGGTFTANTKTSGAYGVQCAASCLAGAEEDATIQVAARGVLTIYGGTFNANATTSDAYGVYSSGTTVIDGGTFNANAITENVYGAIANRGTMDITGGTFNAVTAKTAYGICANGWIDGNTGLHEHAVVTVDGVTVKALANSTTSAYGVIATATSAELTQAKYDARSADNKKFYFTETSDASVSNYYRYRIGSYVEGGELIVNGGTFTAEAASSTAVGAYAAVRSLVSSATIGRSLYGEGKLTVNDGTFNVNTGTTTAEGVRSYGQTIINGGTFTATAKTNTAYGVRALGGKTIVSGGIFNTTAANTAIGVAAQSEIDGAYGFKQEADVIVENGTFNVQTCGGGTAYGTWVHGTNWAGIPSSVKGASTMSIAAAGTLTVKDGTFSVKASNNNTVYGIKLDATQTKNDAVASPKATVLGGFFNINGATSGSGAVNTSATADNCSITGGHYSSKTNLSKYVSSPSHVVDCNEEEFKTTYPYEVTDYYTLTWDAAGGELSGTYTQGSVQYGTAIVPPTTVIRTGYEFMGWDKDIAAAMPAEDVTYTATWLPLGSPLDIVDWTDSRVVVNMNGFSTSKPGEWTIMAKNGTQEQSYTKNNRNKDRTLDIAVTGLKPDEMFAITYKCGDEVDGRRSYRVPHIYESDATLSGTTESSIVLVRSGVLTIDKNTTVDKLYVGQDAELVVKSGVTLTVDSLILRTTSWAAASLDNHGTINATKVYYTRIVADKTQFFQFAIPAESNVNNVTLSNGDSLQYNKYWLLKSYDEFSRAVNGATGGNWKQVAKGATIEASKGYEIFSNSGYYRELYFPVDISSVKTAVAVSHTDNGAAGPAHAGWNALCSPLLGKYKQTFTEVSEAIKISELTGNGNYWQHIPDVIRPAVPFYYQAPQTGTLDFSGSELVQKAPRCAWHTSVSTQWLRLMLNDATGKMLDETDIFTHPDKFSAHYESGYDVIKQSTTGGKALLYSELACGALAFAALPDSVAESRIPISVYTAEAKAHTFHLEDNAYLNRLNNVFLHDTETGAVIDLMTSDYEAMLREGTTRGRFYITCVFRAQNVTTDIETTVQDKQTATIQKVFYNGKVYILRNGIVYDLTGRQCEMK